MAGNSAAEKAARIAKIKADRESVWGARNAAEAKAKAEKERNNPNSVANRAARTAKIKADREKVLGPQRAAEAKAAAQRAAERTSRFGQAKARADSGGGAYTPSVPRQKTAAEKAADAKRASERESNFNKARERAGGSPTPPTSIASAAKRWSQSKEEAVSLARRQRAKQGQYKGKYYGPDAFKGNISKIEAWKKKGKPPIAAFLKK